MIYKDTWNLTGTDQQIKIVKDALDKIFFPWERLNLPKKPTEIGWRDLNNGMYAKDGVDEHGDKFESIAGKLDKPSEVRSFHGGIDHVRNYIFGVMYPASGRLYIDNYLVQRPDMAAATVSAEIAHDVDYFLPLTDDQRNQIMALLHPNGPDEHSWWEKQDYGVEYFDLVGESFMILFTDAYSDIPFGNRDDFSHPGNPLLAPQIRKIIGVERTDAVIEPAKEYFKTVSSKTYHSKKHGNMKIGISKITDIRGLKPCKICIK